MNIKQEVIFFLKRRNQYNEQRAETAWHVKLLTEFAEEYQAKIIGEANAQANVSGNEANQPENKKDGEVALPALMMAWEMGCFERMPVKAQEDIRKYLYAGNDR